MWEGDVPTARCPPWTALTALAELDDVMLRASCRRQHYARGEVIFHEGDAAGEFHLVDKGMVTVQLTTPLGDTVIVDVLQVGDTFGEQALVDDVGERTATVTALDKTETLRLDLTTFRELRTTHPGFDRFLLMVVSRRLHATSQQLLEALYLPAEARLLRCLCRLSLMFAGSIPLTQADLASMSGITRSTANRLLRHIERTGVIEIERARIRVIDDTGLRRSAGLRATTRATSLSKADPPSQR